MTSTAEISPEQLKKQYANWDDLSPEDQKFLTQKFIRKSGAGMIQVSNQTKVADINLIAESNPEYIQSMKAMIAFVPSGAEDYGGFGVPRMIVPPKPLALLEKLADQNVDIATNCDSYAINVGGMGWMLEPVIPVSKYKDKNGDVRYYREDTEEDIDKSLYDLVMAEYPRAKAFVEYMFIDKSYSTTMTDNHRWLAKIGNNFWEVRTDTLGKTIGFTPFEDPTKVYACKQDKKPSEFVQYIRVGDSVVERKIHKYFRRYAAVSGNRVTYYKEFGNPNEMDARTGKYYGKLETKPDGFVPAKEIIHHKLRGKVYGKAIWDPSFVDAYTARSIRLTNRETMDNSGVPRMAIVILNSTDTELEKKILMQLKKARETGSRETIMLIRVKPEEMGFGPQSEVVKPEVKFEPLSKLQEKDGMFLGLSKYIREDIDTAFRIPSILKGRAGVNTNRAVAYIEKQTSENQVFSPPRRGYDEWFNMNVMLPMGFMYWRLVSLGAPNRDTEMFVQLMNLFIQGGAYRPNDLRARGKELLDQEMPRIDEEWADIPRFSNYFVFQQQQLEQMINNAGQGTDPGAVAGSTNATPSNQAFASYIHDLYSNGKPDIGKISDLAKEGLIDFAQNMLIHRGQNEILDSVTVIHA